MEVYGGQIQRKKKLRRTPGGLKETPESKKILWKGYNQGVRKNCIPKSGTRRKGGLDKESPLF